MKLIYTWSAIAILVSQAGCYTTRVLAAPQTELTSVRAGRIWVTQRDGSEIVMTAARVFDDSIFGFNTAGRQLVLPLKDAKSVEVRELSTLKTVAVGLGVLAVATTIAIYFKGKGAGDPNLDGTIDARMH